MYKQLAYFVVFAVTTSAVAGDIPTRFGTLKINDENMLPFKGRPLSPEIQGNNSLSVKGNYQLGASDVLLIHVLLIQDHGGVGCPAMLYFVAVSASGVKATPAFGTCSDLVEVEQQDGGAVSVTMPGFMGPFESKAAQAKAAKQEYVYLYKNGLLTENGEPVK
jgi:hypothetical protein